MRWLDGDQGAVSVIIAFSMILLLGCGAIVMDVGRIYAETRQLQNGADAAALAIAQQCASGACGDHQAVAEALANANSNDGASNAAVQLPGQNGTSSVTVTTSTRADGNSFLTHTLGQALGVPTSTFARTATATWGYPAASGTTVPVAMSICEWDLFTGGLGVDALPTDINTVTLHDPNAPGICGGPANQDSPGGFGWLDTDSGCQADVDAGFVDGNTGNSLPSGCSGSFFQSLLNREILMPLFEQVNGVGSNTVYTIVGFAGFELTGYRVGNGTGNVVTSPPPCHNSTRCLQGRFVNHYNLDGEPSLSPSAPNFGAVIVSLTG